jgi:hypothetical protein
MFDDITATIMLIAHSIMAVFILGALTHQVISVYWAPKPAVQPGFVASVRAVRGTSYTNAVVVMYLITAILGALIYTTYRIEVRQFYLDEYKLYKMNGLFELKEHLAALGVGLLPAYWYYWRNPSPENATARAVLSAYLALSVWFAFIVGHLLVNIQGFGR